MGRKIFDDYQERKEAMGLLVIHPGEQIEPPMLQTEPLVPGQAPDLKECFDSLFSAVENYLNSHTGEVDRQILERTLEEVSHHVY